MFVAPPPPLVSLEVGIVSYLQAHRFTFPRQITLEMAEAGEMSVVRVSRGMTPLAEAHADGRIVIRRDMAEAPITGQTVSILLHETLHETVTGGAEGSWDAGVQDATEQATEAMAQDLWPAVMRSLRIPTTSGQLLAYSDLVKRERVWSARVCRCGWQTPAARAARARQFFTPASARRVVAPEYVTDPSHIVARIA